MLGKAEDGLLAFGLGLGTGTGTGTGTGRAGVRGFLNVWAWHSSYVSIVTIPGQIFYIGFFAFLFM